MVIRIVNLQTQALIGVYDHEKLHRQPLFVDMELHCSLPPELVDGDLASVPDYSTVEARVKERVEASHTGLVEVLARDLVHIGLGMHPSIDSVKVRIRKPSAVRWSDYVEVELQADRDGWGEVRVV